MQPREFLHDRSKRIVRKLKTDEDETRPSERLRERTVHRPAAAREVGMISRYTPAILLATIVACSPPSSQSIRTSFSLKCQGFGRVAVTRDGIKQPSRVGTLSTIYYRWNGETMSTVTDHGATEPTAFCHDEGQEECSAQIVGEHLLASSFDLVPGKAPNWVGSFEEKIDINLKSLVGTAIITNSIGTLTDQAEHVAFKVNLEIPLQCERTT